MACREETLQCRQCENACVIPCDFTRRNDLKFCNISFSSRREQTTKTLCQWQVRLQSFVGICSGDVHCIRHEVTRQSKKNLVSNIEACTILGFCCAGTKVWRYDNARNIKQRRLCCWFLVEHVESRTSDHAGLHCFCKVRFVDDATTSDIDDAQRWLCLLEHLLVKQVDGFLVFGQVHRDEVRTLHQSVEIQHLNIHGTRTLIRHEWIKRNNAHAECRCTLCDQLANTTKTNDTKGLVEKFDAFPLAALPAAILQCAVSLRNIARNCQQHRHGVLGSRHDV